MDNGGECPRAHHTRSRKCEEQQQVVQVVCGGGETDGKFLFEFVRSEWSSDLALYAHLLYDVTNSRSQRVDDASENNNPSAVICMRNRKCS